MLRSPRGALPHRNDWGNGKWEMAHDSAAQIAAVCAIDNDKIVQARVCNAGKCFNNGK